MYFDSEIYILFQPKNELCRLNFDDLWYDSSLIYTVYVQVKAQIMSKLQLKTRGPMVL